MELELESVLHRRWRELNTRVRRKRSVVLSAGLHVFVLSSFLIVPLLTSKEPEPIEFRPITIVPVQALGIENPVTPAPRKEVPTKPESLPDEAPAEPEKSAPSTPERTPSETPSAATPSEPPRGDLGQRQGSALGSSLGTSAFGAAVGGLDNPDFVYGYYVDQMLAMIGTNWQRPALGAEIEAMIHFRIYRDGHISDVRIVRSSGYNSYDLAGLRAVHLAAPFPKLPQSFQHKSLGVNLILR